MKSIFNYSSDAPTGFTHPRPSNSNPNAPQPRFHPAELSLYFRRDTRTMNEKAAGSTSSSNHPERLWRHTSQLLTICCCSFCLSSLLGKKTASVQQAWREKVALCMIIALLSLLVAFFTVMLRRVLCVEIASGISLFNVAEKPFARIVRDDVSVLGQTYAFDDMTRLLDTVGISLGAEYKGRDISRLFVGGQPNDPCARYEGVSPPDCLPLGPSPRTRECPSVSLLNRIWPTGRLYLDWDLIGADPISDFKNERNNLIVYNNVVINVTDLIDSKTANSTMPTRIRYMILARLGQDWTLGTVFDRDSDDYVRCLRAKSAVGFLGVRTPGCAAYDLISAVILVIILGLVLTRFFMALAFHWFISPRLVSETASKRAGRRRGDRYFPAAAGMNVNAAAEDEPFYTAILVTCYSESEPSIRGTLDSLAATDYPDDRKLLFVVADGLITGSGNMRSTPDIITDMITVHPHLQNPVPRSYLAVAEGLKQHNKATVHAGFYKYGGRLIPTVAVVKCGTEDEQRTGKKPGNRGKRDSQLILMNFFARVTFDERMTPLDYELYRCIQIITGQSPNLYDLVLMVDADTVVRKSALPFMVRAMKNDPRIMGLCGETRIANKFDSFITSIQVFEYFTSHNLSKAFEAVFGGVTCLPGCFSMFRIKSIKQSFSGQREITPILVNQDILEKYSDNRVDTLHKKNLLLLGEDRFLSTLLLKTFPKRKMMFVPKAICYTTVPDTFKVLLSQRRRWINSTIHNLLELAIMPGLCGVFCLSMQFVVILELIGTAVLPAALVFTIYLLISAIAGQVETIPLIILLCVLGLPALSILVTTTKPIYCLWMFIYLLALPIWNFILPLYSFWHFDDFTWGETRKVDGEEKQVDHSVGDKRSYMIGSVPFKPLLDWQYELHGITPSPEFSTPTPIPTLPLMHRPSQTRIEPIQFENVDSVVYEQYEPTHFSSSETKLRHRSLPVPLPVPNMTEAETGYILDVLEKEEEDALTMQMQDEASSSQALINPVNMSRSNSSHTVRQEQFVRPKSDVVPSVPVIHEHEETNNQMFNQGEPMMSNPQNIVLPRVSGVQGPRPPPSSWNHSNRSTPNLIVDPSNKRLSYARNTIINQVASASSDLFGSPSRVKRVSLSDDSVPKRVSQSNVTSSTAPRESFESNSSQRSVLRGPRPMPDYMKF